MHKLTPKDTFTIDKTRKTKVNKAGNLLIPIISELGERIRIELTKEEVAKMLNEVKPFSDFYKLNESSRKDA